MSGLLLAALCHGSCPLPAAAGTRLEFLVPAYQYPTLGDLWPRLALAAPRVPLFAIVNPGNGPGPAVDPNYGSAVASLRAAGGRTLGYVPTGYTDSSLAGVIAKVDAWLAFYPMDGFFIDETTSDADPAHLDYYAAIYSAIKARGASYRVVLNPGTGAIVDYLTRPCGETQVVFENTWALVTTPPPPWVATLPPDRSASLVYAVPDAATMRSTVALIAQRGEGLVYVTDDSLPNPWDTLPPYWDEEVAVVETTNVVSTVGVTPAGEDHPALRLGAPYPNPAARVVRLTLMLATSERVSVRVLDLAGRTVATLVDAELPAGEHELPWSGRDTLGTSVAAGLY